MSGGENGDGTEGMMKRLRQIGLIGAAAVLALAFGAAELRPQGGSATAPTAAQDPAAIDQIWQRASAKYDGARQTLLGDVARVDGEGPYRADW